MTLGGPLARCGEGAGAARAQSRVASSGLQQVAQARRYRQPTAATWPRAPARSHVLLRTSG